MKKPLPYRWLPQDHLETASMNHNLHSCYRLLWDACWVHEGLPKDLSDLAMLCHTSLPEFERNIWPKLKDFFYKDENGKLWVGDLEPQKSKLDDVRDSQSKRAKHKRKKLPATRRLTPGKPTAKDSEVIFGPTQITNSPRITAGKPPDNRRVEITAESEPITAAGEPPASPRLSDKVQKIVDLTVESLNRVADERESRPSAFDKFVKPEISPAIPEEFKKPETPNNVSRETTLLEAPVLNETKQVFDEITGCYFDKEGAWRKIVAIFPGSGMGEAAQEAFVREIISRTLYRRIQRAASRYRVQVNEKTAKLMHFMDWFSEWQKYEG